MKLGAQVRTDLESLQCMSDLLFDYFATRGFGTRKLSSRAAAIIEGWHVEELLRFREDVGGLMPYYEISAQSPFEFIASSSFGGSADPCAAMECRLNQVSSMAQFAALYADRVLLPDPFEIATKSRGGSLEEIKGELFVHLTILYALRPLIRIGIVGFAHTHHYRFCRACYARLIGATPAAHKKYLSTMMNELAASYSKNTKVSFHHEDDDFFFKIVGPDTLVPHGSAYFRPNESLRRRLEESYSKKRNPKLPLSDLRFPRNHFVQGIADDVLRQDYYSRLFGTSYLTHREIDMRLISSIGHQEDKRRNALLLKDFAHDLPTLGDIDLLGALKLRKSEPEAFAVYQNALRESLDLAKSETGEKIRQVFQDVVRPELDKLDVTVRNYRRTLKTSLAQDAVVGSGFVAMGLFAGFLPGNIGAIVAALGGFHYASNVAKKISQLLSAPENIRDHRWYFLWRARGKAR